MFINGLSIKTLIAANQEYGDAMKKTSINPDFIGVGPIEATFNTTKLLCQLEAQNKLPDAIFSIGTAGSNTLKQGEIYQITKVGYRDMNAVAFGFEAGVTPFADYPATFDLPILYSDMPTATLSTGAAVIDKQGSSGLSFDQIDADCVDMETYAIIRVARHFKIPVIALRGISDGTEESTGIQSWEEYLKVIDFKFSEFYHRLQNENTPLMRIIADYKSSTYED